MIWFILTIVAYILYIPLALISTPIGIIQKGRKKYLKKTARQIDILGCIVVSPLLNLLIRKEFRNKYKFGEEEVTISEMLGLFYYIKVLNKSGLNLVKLVDFFDFKQDKHCYNAYLNFLKSEEFEKWNKNHTKIIFKN